MLKIILLRFLLAFTIPTSVELEETTGKICGTYNNRLCTTDSKGPTLTGLIFLTVVVVLIFLIILKACLPCCPRIKGYHPLSSDPAYAARSGAVVCTVAASHC